MENTDEPFETVKTVDLTHGYHLIDEDLNSKRKEIYDQINYLTNELKMIDQIYADGDQYLTEQEVSKLLRLDDINGGMKIPRDIPKIRLGVGYIYMKKDINEFIESRRK